MKPGIKLVQRGVCMAVCFLFTACASFSPLPEATPEPTETATPMPSSTPTIVWFPSTSTPTPFATPTVAPTLEMRPGLGAVLLHDTFEQSIDWLTIKNANGSIQFGENQLTIAISKSKGYMSSLRAQPFLKNFYLEIIAAPSLCKGEDSYGLLFRATGYQDTYRFAVACNGTTRVERVRAAEVVVLQSWTPSGQVPPGAPAQVRLGVWANGKEIRFFIRDEYQFTVRDGVFPGGMVGVFARSGGGDVMTVNFEELLVQEISGYVPPAPTTPVGTATKAP